MQAVQKAGYETPTAVQAQGIPLILEGRDVIGASQTGTGKTAAFSLPVLTRLGETGKLRCLVLEPTRELAAQVEHSFATYGEFTNLRTLLVHGGVGYGAQRDGLERGVDIMVATPGRLLDHMQQGTIKLGDIEVLILDEVDRMLDMGFLPDVRRIVQKCPSERQTLFFSATMPDAIASLASWTLTDPVKVAIAPRTPASTVRHFLYPVASDQREELLFALLKETDFKSLMIFTRRKVEADKLSHMLRKEHPALTTMHSDIPQRDRAKALTGFREGTFDIIVATDLAARGLDITDVTHVVNFHVPENAEDYVHRIGRTGRAEKEGDAFTIFVAEELPFVEAVERFIGRKIERRKVAGFPYNYTTLLDEDAPSQEKIDAIRRRNRPKSRRRRR